MRHMVYSLNKNIKTPIYIQLYQQIKKEIQKNKLKIGSKLPSKKKLSLFLDISRNTVESAYEQLKAEGYIESINRKGYYVCYCDNNLKIDIDKQKIINIKKTNKNNNNISFDFNPNVIDTSTFPFKLWRQKGKALFNENHQELLSLGDNQGESGLREELAKYLYASRGVNCNPNQIIVAAGVENCLFQLNLLFEDQLGEKISYSIEEYGYQTVFELLKLLKRPVNKVPLLNSKQQINLNILEQINSNIIYITPSNQYPYGEVLSINSRLQLLDWVKKANNKYLIEDDYDSEFRFKGKPIPALQSLDSNEKVIYLGTLSKLLMPSIRFTYMVLPLHLLEQYNRTCGFLKCSVSRLDQCIVAKLIQDGDFERHINKMRKIYRNKMEYLCEQIAHYKPCIAYYGEESGLYLLIEIINETRSISELVALALRVGIKVYPVKIKDKKVFSLGYANLDKNKILQGVELLMSCWGIDKSQRCQIKY